MHDRLWVAWVWAVGCGGCEEGFGFIVWGEVAVDGSGHVYKLGVGGVGLLACPAPQAFMQYALFNAQISLKTPQPIPFPPGHTLVPRYPRKTHLGKAPHKCLATAWKLQAAIWLKGAVLSGATTSARSHRYRSVTACAGSTTPSLCSISQERRTIP